MKSSPVFFMTHKDIGTSGTRIREIRRKLGYSRNHFGQRNNLSHHTLESLELDRLTLTSKMADRICQAFKNEGLFVSPDWLMSGKEGPVSDTTAKNTVSSSILQDLKSILHYEGEILSHLVTDDSMAPQVMPGDVVFGRVREPQNYATLSGKNCIVSLTNKTLMVRRFFWETRLECPFTFISTNASSPIPPLFLEERHIQGLAPLEWVRKIQEV